MDNDYGGTQCIVCKKEIAFFQPTSKTSGIHPLSAVCFRSYGHYGTAVFDPMDSSFIEIVVCDDCVVENIDLMIGSGEINEER